jgi:GntR family transcriptional regulator, transcriptional repressor for pyruvate dehydrogenase complex
MSDAQPARLADRQVHLPRVADVVADRIRELILTGGLADGERLPRLDTLLEQFGVSAPSMREALRILEAEGLIAVQRGSVGGAVVHRPNAWTAAYTLALVLRSRGTEVGDVADALGELEPLCAMFCARRKDRAQRVVRPLRKINATSRSLIDGDHVAYNESSVEFHAAIVRHCGNATLTLVVGALESVWLGDVEAWLKATTTHGTYPTPAERLGVLELHEHVADLIAAGEDLEAYKVMRSHADHRLVYGNEVDPRRPVDPRAVRSSK